VVQKPVQDIVTSLLCATFILLLAGAGVMMTVHLPQSGVGWFEVDLTRVDADNPRASLVNRSPPAGNGLIGCEVLYQQASLGRAQLASFSEPEPDDVAALYYAVYICTGVSITTGSYI